jgi:hypothetical protein
MVGFSVLTESKNTKFIDIKTNIKRYRVKDTLHENDNGMVQFYVIS